MSSFSAELTNKLLALIRNQVIILLIGGRINEKSQQKLLDIETAVQQNSNDLCYVNRFNNNFSSAQMTDALTESLCKRVAFWW